MKPVREIVEDVWDWLSLDRFGLWVLIAVGTAILAVVTIIEHREQMEVPCPAGQRREIACTPTWVNGYINGEYMSGYVDQCVYQCTPDGGSP